jgi:hypothetical protein
LIRQATIKEPLTVRQEGARQVEWTFEFCNLDAIISVGYRAFCERRRLQAEQPAEKRYIEDLKSVAET